MVRIGELFDFLKIIRILIRNLGFNRIGKIDDSLIIKIFKSFNIIYSFFLFMFMIVYSNNRNLVN